MASVNPPLLGLIVDQLGFVTGVVLYSLLLGMVWRERSQPGAVTSRSFRLPLLTGACGLAWNVGALVALDYGARGSVPAATLIAVAFAALGFLPAVVVHSVLEGREPGASSRLGPTAVVGAYVMSAAAGMLHVLAAASGDPVPSPPGLWVLTIGFGLLATVLLVVTRQQPVGRRGVWIVALSIFAVSALHFNRHAGDEAWWVELIGHHASLPLAVAILHQDYRFAFADLFVKHAVALLMLVGTGLLLVSSIVLPSLGSSGSAYADPRALTMMILVWMGTVVMYGRFRQWAGRFVDRAFLQRPDYAALLDTFKRAVDRAEHEDAVLRATAEVVRHALGSPDVTIVPDIDSTPDVGSPLPLVDLGAVPRGGGSVLPIRTVEAPTAALVLGPLTGGRRLLSDDVHWMTAVATLAAHRIDALRVSRERHARDLREAAIERLAAQAELRALRAQLQPHFLFNALTTIGYLIQQSPSRALDTLLQLTTVLRGVLMRSNREFSTLGEELDLVRSYVDIERARFEERLDAQLDVASEVRDCVVPTLMLQPIVENAIRHGIARKAAGGSLRIGARIDRARLEITVEDTGAGFTVDAPSGAGVGLRSVEERLRVHYAEAATLDVRSAAGIGTIVTVTLPASRSGAGEPAPVGSR
jgi:two-component system LytT family sensor kinase